MLFLLLRFAMIRFFFLSSSALLFAGKSKRKSQTAAGLGKLDFCVQFLLSRILLKISLSLTGAITPRAL